MPVPSPQAGKIAKILVGEGDTVESAGDLRDRGRRRPRTKPARPRRKASPPPKAERRKKKPKPTTKTTEEEDRRAEESRTRPTPRQQEPEATKPPKSPPPSTPSQERHSTPEEVDDGPATATSSAAAGPAVRRLARELGVDLRRVRPTGAGGRITEEDVRGLRPRSQRAVAATAPTRRYAARARPIRRHRRRAARKDVADAADDRPQHAAFVHHDSAAHQLRRRRRHRLEDMRQESKDDYADSGVKLTTMPFLIKALAAALKTTRSSTPRSTWRANKIIYKEYVNIGIAVDTESGLVVPVLRDADRRTSRRSPGTGGTRRHGPRRHVRSRPPRAARSPSATSARSAAPTRRRSSTRRKRRSCWSAAAACCRCIDEAIVRG